MCRKPQCGNSLVSSHVKCTSPGRIEKDISRNCLKDILPRSQLDKNVAVLRILIPSDVIGCTDILHVLERVNDLLLCRILVHYGRETPPPPRISWTSISSAQCIPPSFPTFHVGELTLKSAASACNKTVLVQLIPFNISYVYFSRGCCALLYDNHFDWAFHEC